MGIIGRIFGQGPRGLGEAVTGVAEVFRPNATRSMELGHEAHRAALDQHGTEFEYGRSGWFDSFINSLNRMPRPMLALGTLGLFVFAMIDPIAFSKRMEGLAFVPDPLWWLLGAIVSFYFGARELHYSRSNRPTPSPQPKRRNQRKPANENAAISAWKAKRMDEK